MWLEQQWFLKCLTVKALWSATGIVLRQSRPLPLTRHMSFPVQRNLIRRRSPLSRWKDRISPRSISRLLGRSVVGLVGLIAGNEALCSGHLPLLTPIARPF